MSTTLQEVPWHSEKIFRLRGIFRDKPPICVSAAFMRSNPRWLFYTLFGSDSQLSEPANEPYTYPDGRTVKVYPLDIPDSGLEILFGFMWQYNNSYVTDYDLISDTYRESSELKRCMSLTAWIKLLRYYGFLDPATIIPGLEPLNSPQMEHLRDCMSTLVNQILTRHPDWHLFETGIHTMISYQFASHPDSEVMQNDGITMCILFSDRKRLMPAESLITSGIGNSRHAILIRPIILEILTQQDIKFGACEIIIDTPKKKDTTVKHWPLTRSIVPVSVSHDCSRLSREERPIGTRLENCYTSVTLTIEWKNQLTKPVFPLS